MLYNYDVLAASVVDGDTVDLTIDLGFGVTRRDRFRLYGPDPAAPTGLDAPELRTPAGRAARDYLAALLVQYAPSGLLALTVRDRREKYGRYLVVLAVGPRGPTINGMLVEAGHAVLREY